MTPEGEMIAEGAVSMIRERQLRNLKILDIGCGVGIIGLTIFSKLNKDMPVRQVAFADINIFNINSLHRTLSINNLEHLLGERLISYLSDGLKHIPHDEKFDIIVSNPPHYLGQDPVKGKNAFLPGGLGTYDADWAFHKSFYRQCHDYLTEGGEVWFLENSSSTTEKDFLPFIEANAQLKYIKKIQEPLNPRFFWMITRKA
jgi:16S rRNA G1207 methylase RsmC